MIRQVTRPTALRHSCAALWLALALAAGVLPGAAQARQSVLFIFDEDKDLPGLALINRSLREVFQREMKDGVELSIVEAHGGRIWADRNDKRGITLHIHLPVPPRPDEASGERGAVEAGSAPPSP